jgi:hypothetical protein
VCDSPVVQHLRQVNDSALMLIADEARKISKGDPDKSRADTAAMLAGDATQVMYERARRRLIREIISGHEAAKAAALQLANS